MTLATVNRKSQYLFVVTILLVAVVIAVMLFVFKPRAEKKPAPYSPPEVSWISADAQTVRIPVHSQGTVEASATINLSVEVPGKISEIRQKLDDGEFFVKDDLLARIDDRDYQLAITKAEAQVAAARQALARVEAEAEQARFDIKRMGQDVAKASPYALREPHLKEARAKLKAAEADLAIARLNEQRTYIRAPFDGRVIKKNVDVGEYVAPGVSLAKIFSTRRLQVKLPLSQRQQALINLPHGEEDPASTRVVLQTRLAGELKEWPAHLTRTESTIDVRNRLLNVIAEIDTQPLLDGEVNLNSLTAGLFVEAIIEGRPIDNIFVLPRTALRSGNKVWRIKDDKLDIVDVNVMHKNDSEAYIDKGLKNGDRIIVSALDYAIQGMRLNPHRDGQ